MVDSARAGNGSDLISIALFPEPASDEAFWTLWFCGSCLL